MKETERSWGAGALWTAGVIAFSVAVSTVVNVYIARAAPPPGSRCRGGFNAGGIQRARGGGAVREVCRAGGVSGLPGGV